MLQAKVCVILGTVSNLEYLIYYKVLCFECYDIDVKFNPIREL